RLYVLPRSSSFALLYCYGQRWHLHSFPTRRSSDLALATLDLVLGTNGRCERDELDLPQDRHARRIDVRQIGDGDTDGRQCASREDRKSTRLNSSHLGISYAVFCLKKKKKNIRRDYT